MEFLQNTSAKIQVGKSPTGCTGSAGNSTCLPVTFMLARYNERRLLRRPIYGRFMLMLKSRLFEEAIAKLWHDGLISGEMHLGTGEEAIIAGVFANLREGDAMALDHRGTAAMLMRGVDPVLVAREMLGYPDGLCGGMGGHMHLYEENS